MFKNFKVKKGDEFGFAVTFKNLSQNPSEIMFGLKKDLRQEDYDLLLTIGNGIERIAGYQYSVRISPEQCDKLINENYTYDLRFKIDNTIKTPLSGKMVVSETVFN